MSAHGSTPVMRNEPGELPLMTLNGTRGFLGRSKNLGESWIVNRLYLSRMVLSWLPDARVRPSGRLIRVSAGWRCRRVLAGQSRKPGLRRFLTLVVWAKLQWACRNPGRETDP